MLNLIRIIYSLIMCHKYTDTLDDDIYKEMFHTCSNWWLTDPQIVSYCRTLKAEGKGRYDNWTLPQMFREAKYHSVLYRHGLFKSHTDYVDFEEVQTLKTYIRRILGNCLW